MEENWVNYPERYYSILKWNIVAKCKEYTISFPKNSYFPESFKFETMNKQKQPEKKPFPTGFFSVFFYTNDFSDLIDKSTSQG